MAHREAGKKRFWKQVLKPNYFVDINKIVFAKDSGAEFLEQAVQESLWRNEGGKEIIDQNR
jgi:hypothetical protein